MSDLNNPPQRPRIVIIVGPTGVGKSAVAIELAGQFGGEIVNADAMQVYRRMDIGTAKPTIGERRGIPHHLLDVVDPDEEFNAARFAALAGEKIAEIRGSGRPVFIVGGTGLYIKALTQGLFEGPPADAELRRRYRERIDTEGVEALYRELQEKDPAAAARIQPRDQVRIIRALEIVTLSGETITLKQAEHGFRDEPYEALKIGLTMDRTMLYERIDARCKRMVDDGLVDEVRGLLAAGYDASLKPMGAIGYRQTVAYLRGDCDLAAALADMQQETRRYAKRQWTWFRGDKEVRWFTPDQLDAIPPLVEAFYRSDSECLSSEKP